MPGVPDPGDEYATEVHRWWHLSRPSPKLARALDAGSLGSPGTVLDRGCFHYLERCDRGAYAAEARRVLGPGGRLFLRGCLSTAGRRNDIDEDGLREVFAAWRWRGQIGRASCRERV